GRQPEGDIDVLRHTGLAAAWLLAGVVAGLFGTASRGGAEEVEVTVVVILATDRNKQVDADLKAIAEEVRKKYPELTGVRLERMRRDSLTVGKSEKFALVDDKVATVLVRHGADGKNRVGLTVKAPLQGEIEYTTCCGKFLPIVTRYRTKADNERLIL